MSVAWYVRSRAARLGLVASILGLALLVGASAVSAAAAITLTTPYPADRRRARAPASASTSRSRPTAAAASTSRSAGAPADWTAVLRGGGFTIDGVETDGTTADEDHPQRDGPGHAAAGTQRIDVAAPTASRRLDDAGVDIRVTPTAAGEVTLTTDTPQLKGASDATFSFSLTLTNDTPEDLPFSAAATGPDRLDGDRPGRVAGAGRERRRQGRRHLPGRRSPPRRRPTRPRARIRSRST